MLTPRKQYIQAFTSRRIRDVNDMIIEDIDSVRNGLFMNKFLHLDLGHTFALLKVSNSHLRAPYTHVPDMSRRR